MTAAVAACATKAKLLPAGGECYQATDCADGLVCVPQKNGPSICSNDLTGVQTVEDATAPPGDASADAGGEGGPGDGGGGQDTGPADTGSAADTATE
jgi:hypothetical protein